MQPIYHTINHPYTSPPPTTQTTAQIDFTGTKTFLRLNNRPRPPASIQRPLATDASASRTTYNVFMSSVDAVISRLDSYEVWRSGKFRF